MNSPTNNLPIPIAGLQTIHRSVAFPSYTVIIRQENCGLLQGLFDLLDTYFPHTKVKHKCKKASKAWSDVYNQSFGDSGIVSLFAPPKNKAKYCFRLAVLSAISHFHGEAVIFYHRGDEDLEIHHRV